MSHCQSGIADALNRDKSTISREVRRNRGLRGYRPGQAQRLALARREARARPRIAPGTWKRVESLLREDWSPEQISGCLSMEQGLHVSHEWIYRHSLCGQAPWRRPPCPPALPEAAQEMLREQ
jgi:IS30 family transposase